MIYVTGDTHNTLNMDKLKQYNFPAAQGLTKDDYVIVTGDFGFVWDGGEEEMFWREWFRKQPYTTLFIDGNHENFDLLNSFPITDWNGGSVHMINDSIIHLMRGQVFELQGKTFFTMGGAASIDKHRRIEGVSWWRQEIPSFKEGVEATCNLDHYDYNVDYVLTHTCPTFLTTKLGFNPIPDPTQSILDNIQEIITFKHWYFGHFHADRELEEYTALFEEIKEVRT